MSSRSKFHVRHDTDRQNAHVYLVARRVGVGVHAPIRVGIAQDLAAQIATLQDSCPFEICLVHALHFPAGRLVATLLQGKFESQHAASSVGRGWFDMDPATALSGLLDQLNALPAWRDDTEDTRRVIMNYLNAGDEAQETLRVLKNEMGMAK